MYAIRLSYAEQFTGPRAAKTIFNSHSDHQDDSTTFSQNERHFAISSLSDRFIGR